MFIIFGANALRKNHGQASRYCLQCNKPTSHELLSERVWFTLFFIPVLPVTWRLFRARCPLCGRETPEKPTMHWTLAPRRGSAVFGGWLFISLAALWLSILSLAFVHSQFSTDPAKPPMGPGAAVIGALCFGVPLGTVSLLFFLRANKLRRQIDAGPQPDECEASWTPTTTKQCPRCAEEIKLDALACRHCSHEFEREQVQSAVRLAESERSERLARMMKQALIDELTTKRTAFLVLGWLSIVTCIMSWLGPFLLWKAHQLGQQLRALREELEPTSASLG